VQLENNNENLQRIIVSEIYAQFGNMVRDHIFKNHNKMSRTEAIRKMAVANSRTNNEFFNGFKQNINTGFN